MKKKNVLKAALICGGVAALGYLVKKAHDINEELNSIRLDNLTEDLFETDIKKTDNEERIFARHPEDGPIPGSIPGTERVTEEDFVDEELTNAKEVESSNESVDTLEEESNQEVENQETEESVLPPEVINKVGKLEDLLTFEGLDFDTNQRDYLYHIIDYMKVHHEMRLALLIGMDYNGKHPLEVFTDNQFAEIKKILR